MMIWSIIAPKNAGIVLSKFQVSVLKSWKGAIPEIEAG
jgi:hypothetical protein